MQVLANMHDEKSVNFEISKIWKLVQSSYLLKIRRRDLLEYCERNIL